MNPPSKNSKSVVTLIVVVVVAVLAYGILTMPDQRTGSERLGDAIHELDKGPEKAMRQLEDRTPGEKLGDAVKDVGDDIKRNTDN